MNDTLILVFVSMLLMMSIISGVFLMAISSILTKISDAALTTMLSTKSIMERLWKIESLVNNLGLMESMTSDLNQAFEQRGRTGMISASTAEEFFSKLSQDPNIKMTPRQVDELRKLFENDINPEEEGDSDEPWKR